MKELEDHLPLKPVIFLILLALADQPLHGYGVIQSVRERSVGRVRLQAGPLYRHLRRLLDEGWVEALPGAHIEDSRRTVRYGLTDIGRDLARLEAKRLRSLVFVSHDLGLIEGGSA